MVSKLNSSDTPSADSGPLSKRLDLACEIAGEAGRLILDYYQQAGLAVDRKSDNSPVTVADREAEQLLRDCVGRSFPEDGFLGEESGEAPSRNGWRWIVDPVDGTKSFVHGVPLFGTLIGVERHGRLVAGVCRMPALAEVVYAAEGQGAWWQTGAQPPRPARVSDVADLSQALHCFTSATGFSTVGRPEVFEALCRRTRLSRGWSDCYGHILVATGRAEVIVEPQMNPWDAAALVPILREAGGSYVDWNGNERIDSGNGLSVNAALKDAVLEIVRGRGG